MIIYIDYISLKICNRYKTNTQRLTTLWTEDDLKEHLASDYNHPNRPHLKVMLNKILIYKALKNDTE